MTPIRLRDVARHYCADPSTRLYSGVLLLTMIAASALVALRSAPVEPPVSPASLGLWVVMGWALYLLQEYLSHVWIFHMPAPRSARLYRWLYRLHMGHHDRPKRLDILSTPIWFTFPVLLVNAALMLAFAPNLLLGSAMLIGLLSGYLLFEWFHLLVHTPYPIRNAWLKMIQRRHLAHHYKNEGRWFTVTPLGSLLDDLFGTGGQVERASSSHNPKNGDLDQDDPRLMEARAHYHRAADGGREESGLWLIIKGQNA